MDCFYETVASVWVSGLRTVNRRALEGDLEKEASEELGESLAHFSGERAKIEARLCELHETIRTRRAELPRAELRKTLIRSRSLKVQLATMDKKIVMLEQNLEKIEEGKSNRIMLSSLKTVNKALKRMGNQADIGDTDQVISDLEENIQISADVTHTLSGSLSSDLNFDDADLEEELGEILGETAPKPLFAPVAPTPTPVAPNQTPVAPNQMEPANQEEAPVEQEAGTA